MSNRPVIRMIAGISLGLISAIAAAADVDSADFANLVESAATQGYARVLINLNAAVSLSRVKNEKIQFREVVEREASTLRTELGSGAFEGGYWNNGLGQIGLYLTKHGLAALKASTNAKSFTIDHTRGMRDTVYGADGSLNAIERQLSTSDYADVEVFPNIEADYDLGPAGTITFRPSATIAQMTSVRVQAIVAMAWSKGIRRIDQSPAARNWPSFTARIDRSAFFGLRESAYVRAIRPLNFQDQRPAKWDSDIVSVAYDKGKVELLLSLRGAPTFSPRTGYMSDAALATQKAAHKRAFDEILRSAGVGDGSVIRRMDDTGSLHLQLSPREATKLVAVADPRVAAAEVSRPIASPALTNSTTLLNVGPAWAAGLIGTGQWVAIFDTGVRSSHLMIGTSRVPYEWCFGTNSSPYSSICPNQSTSGDSPSPYPGSGQPYSNATYCASNPGTCEHGTHVAGIAAGIPSPSTTPNANLPGMAQGASVAAFQVFSYASDNSGANVFEADAVAALDAAYSNTSIGTSNPFTINMSFAGGVPSQACDYYHTSFASKVAQLVSRGVPIVAASGNRGERNSVQWPACISDVVKVSSVANDSLGTQLSDFSNIAPPSVLSGPIFLAPGGYGGTVSPSYVKSASSTNNFETVGIAGTSQASPHIAGLYAMIKAAVPGITVADASAWIIGTASFDVTYNLGYPAGTHTFRRVKLPNSY